MWRIVSENVHKTCYLKLFHLRERKHSPPKRVIFQETNADVSDIQTVFRYLFLR